jgi:hypothetical protein
MACNLVVGRHQKGLVTELGGAGQRGMVALTNIPSVHSHTCPQGEIV